MGKRSQPIVAIITLALILSAQTTTGKEQSKEQGKEHSPKDHESNYEEPPPRDNREELKKHHVIKGHLKPFGESGSKSPVKEVDGFPANFFKDHLLRSAPILMKGAAKMSAAYEKWTDKYLREIGSRPENRKVQMEVEIKKKEVRDFGMKTMTLVDYLDIYNTSDLYAVTDVPSFMEPDLMMPCSLQVCHG